MPSVDCHRDPIWCTNRAASTDIASDEGRTSPETSPHLRDDVVWHLIAQPVYYFAQSNIHEGSHAITTELVGYQVKSYRPYPHMTTINGRKYFLFTGATKIGSDGKKMDSGKLALIMASPMLMDASLFLSADLSLSYTDPDSGAAPFLFFAGMAWPWLDFVIGANLIDEGADAAVYAQHLKVNPYAVLVTGDIIAAVGLWRLIAQGQRALFRKKDNADRPAFHVSPLTTKRMSGLAISGSF